MSPEISSSALLEYIRLIVMAANSCVGVKPVWVAVFLGLIHVAAAAKPCAAKWAQYRDGTVIAVVSIKRAGTVCTDEAASVVDGVLKITMQCAGDEYGLNVPLQEAVHTDRVSIKREPGALVVVSLHKQNAATWWTSLAKEPSKFKSLLTPDVGRGDAEPDPDEFEEMASVAVDAGTGGATNKVSKKAAQAAQAAEQLREQALADWEDVLASAQDELSRGKIKPQTIARLKTLREVLPDQRSHISIVLGTMLLRRGDKAEGDSDLLPPPPTFSRIIPPSPTFSHSLPRLLCISSQHLPPAPRR